MKTETLKVSADHPDPALIAKACAVFRAGGLVAFPTETVYGLGGNALEPAAVARIFAAKGRPVRNPLIVHVADSTAARALASQWPDAATRLAERFWPGPLTLVVAKNERVPDIVTAQGLTVAVRVPAHPVALALLRVGGMPLAAPSANPSTHLSPTRAEHVLQGLAGKIEMILDAGPTAGGLESTVLDVTTTPARLLRPGLIGPGEIEAVIGSIRRPEAASADKQVLRSPGLLGRHYAPRAPLECVAGTGRARVEELACRGMHVGWLTFSTESNPGPLIRIRHMPADPTAYAAELYDALHTLDAAGVDCIVVDLPPVAEEWLAVQDRLRRASLP